MGCVEPISSHQIFFFLRSGPIPVHIFRLGQNWPGPRRWVNYSPRPSFLYAEWILHAGAAWSRGENRRGEEKVWGGNLVVASCHGGVHAVEHGERPVVVAAELVATGGACCLSPPLCRDTRVSFFSFPLLLLFILFPLPRLFSVSSLLVLLFSFFSFFSFLFSSPPLFSPVFLPTLKIPPSCFFVSASVSFASPKPFLL